MSKNLTDSLNAEILRVTEIKKRYEPMPQMSLYVAFMDASIGLAKRALATNYVVCIQVALEDLQRFED